MGDTELCLGSSGAMPWELRSVLMAWEKAGERVRSRTARSAYVLAVVVWVVEKISLG